MQPYTLIGLIVICLGVYLSVYIERLERTQKVEASMEKTCEVTKLFTKNTDGSYGRVYDCSGEDDISYWCQSSLDCMHRVITQYDEG